jgi:hypothetical protein
VWYVHRWDNAAKYTATRKPAGSDDFANDIPRVGMLSWERDTLWVMTSDTTLVQIDLQSGADAAEVPRAFPE